jgi:hypothetical protein
VGTALLTRYSGLFDLVSRAFFAVVALPPFRARRASTGSQTVLAYACDEHTTRRIRTLIVRVAGSVAVVVKLSPLDFWDASAQEFDVLCYRFRRLGRQYHGVIEAALPFAIQIAVRICRRFDTSRLRQTVRPPVTTGAEYKTCAGKVV